MSDEYQLRKDIDDVITDIYQLKIDGRDLNVYTKDEIKQNYYDISDIEVRFNEMINLIYPVGSIYLSVNDIDPSTLFGGVWEQIKDSFLLASGDTYPLTETVVIDDEEVTRNVTGGSADAIVVEHSHSYSTSPHYYSEKDTSQSEVITPTSGSAKFVTKYTNSEGVDGTGKNMPPYLTVNVWRRIE